MSIEKLLLKFSYPSILASRGVSLADDLPQQSCLTDNDIISILRSFRIIKIRHTDIFLDERDEMKFNMIYYIYLSYLSCMKLMDFLLS